MSWVRIWIHLVFSTKDRIPFMNSRELRAEIFAHILHNAKEKSIWIDCLNGYQQHLHCLISLDKEHSISKIAQLIKGESSFWINKNNLVSGHFSWQDDYWAVSISESHMIGAREYIFSQEEHHRKKSFDEEIDLFMEKQGWQHIKPGKLN
jgi:putative transposase